ncbi:MAG: hypothetical protein OEY36_06975 [Gammaproteobacteria bacterium]|nr:hypothetical protein [Gammaproteobacteria bacterium]
MACRNPRHDCVSGADNVNRLWQVFSAFVAQISYQSLDLINKTARLLASIAVKDRPS